MMTLSRYCSPSGPSSSSLTTGSSCVDVAGARQDDNDGNTNNQKATPSLGRNLTWHRRDGGDPFEVFEVLSVLGTGSMGSVRKVRKRDAFVGGSARLEHRRGGGRTSSSSVGLSLLQSCFLSGGEARKRNALVTDLRASPRRSDSTADLLDLLYDDDDDVVVAPHYEVLYAFKSIHLDRVHDPSFVTELRNEIDILQRLDHPNIVRPIETFRHDHQLYVVMELCTGGDLYSRDPYTERQARRIVRQLVSAIAYLHRRNIMHRDLKYENILFENDGPDADIKIIDFGLSKKYQSANATTFSDHVGTIYTMAPEVLTGNYTHKADLWAVGVLTFMLLTSQMPFYGKKRRQIADKIKHCRYNMSTRHWDHISEEAKEFVRSMLQIEPESRPEAITAKKAAWLQSRPSMVSSLQKHPQHYHSVSYGVGNKDNCNSDSSDTESTSSIHSSSDEDKENNYNSPTREVDMTNVRVSLKRFADFGKLKKLALLVVAHKSTSEELGNLRIVFDEFDKDNIGTIDYARFRSVLLSHKGCGDDDEIISENEIKSVFESVNLDGTGQIHYTEFIAATLESQGIIEEERLAEAFDRLDSDDSGYISTMNLRDLFSGEISDSSIHEIILEAGENDNKISYNEFLSMWNPEAGYPEQIDCSLYSNKSAANLPKQLSELSFS